MNTKSKLLIVGLAIFVWGCLQATGIRTPETIGVKKRMRVISGDQAAAVVNKLHGGEVAGDDNVIADVYLFVFFSCEYKHDFIGSQEY